MGSLLPGARAIVLSGDGRGMWKSDALPYWNVAWEEVDKGIASVSNDFMLWNVLVGLVGAC